MKLSVILLTLYLGLMIGRACADGYLTALSLALGLGIPSALAYFAGRASVKTKLFEQ